MLTSVRQSFAIDFDLPEGVKWKRVASGGLALFDEQGVPVANIAAPWAVDAAGRRLPTNYVVTGNKVEQRIDFRGAKFPVVADPNVAWWVATGLKCGAEIATTFGPLAATKVARIAKNLTSLAKKSTKVAAAIKALGGVKNASVALAKLAVEKVKSSKFAKYVKLPSVSLTAEQRKQAAVIWAFIGNNIWRFLGFGSCGEMVAAI